MKHLKRIVLSLMLIFAISIISSQNANAQVYTYKTTQYAENKKNSDGNWTEWSDWMDSDMSMVINFNTDVVTIYSPTTQRYEITKFIRSFTDSSGGKQVEFAFTDQDGVRGHMRLRIETNGNSQIYIEFSNIMWVYNVRRTN